MYFFNGGDIPKIPERRKLKRMGASISKTSAESVTKSLNEAITNAIISQQQSCSAATQTTQSVGDVTISGSKGVDINLTSSSKLSLQCLSQMTNSLEFQNKIKAELEAAVAAQSTSTSSLGLNVSSSNARTYQESINRVATNFDISSVQNCVSNFAATQTANKVTINSSEDVKLSFSISSEQLTSCVASNSSTASAVSDLSAQLTSNASATATSALLSTGGLIACLVCCCFVCISLLMSAAFSATLQE